MTEQKVIYKYQLPWTLGEEFGITVKYPSKFLTAQKQRESLALWFEVHPTSETSEERKFKMFPTGVPFDIEKMQYLTTLQNGGLVFHLYEVFS